MACEDVCDTDLPLPKGWIKAMSKKFDKPYFYHENTKCSIWVHPALLQEDGKVTGSKKDHCSSSSNSIPASTTSEKCSSTSKSMMEVLGLTKGKKVAQKNKTKISPILPGPSNARIRERSPVEPTYEDDSTYTEKRPLNAMTNQKRFGVVGNIDRESRVVNYNVLTNCSATPKLKPLPPIPPLSTALKLNRKRRSSECEGNTQLETQAKLVKVHNETEEENEEEVEEEHNNAKETGTVRLTPAMKAIMAKRKAKGKSAALVADEEVQPESSEGRAESSIVTRSAAKNPTPAMKKIFKKRERKKKNVESLSADGEDTETCKSTSSSRLKNDTSKTNNVSPPPPPPPPLPASSTSTMGDIIDKCSSFINSLNPLRSRSRAASENLDNAVHDKSRDKCTPRPLRPLGSNKSDIGRKAKSLQKGTLDSRSATSSYTRTVKEVTKNQVLKSPVPLKPPGPLKPLKPLNALKSPSLEKGRVSCDGGLTRTELISRGLSTSAKAADVRRNLPHVSDKEFDEVEDMEVDPVTMQINKDIQELREHQVFQKPIASSASVAASDQNKAKPVYTDPLYIVIDTNVLLSDVQLVTELKDYPFPVVGAPNLIIPWMVLQELDSLKDAVKRTHTRSNEDGEQSSENLSLLARKAIGFIGDCLDSQHPRVKGQSAIEAATPVPGFTEESNDDSIIHCALCLKLQSSQSNVVILSNDRNLCNKAIVFGVTAFTQKTILGGISKLFGESNQKHPDDTEKINLLEKQIDEVSCEFQSILRDVFTKIIETEMVSAYGDDLWLEIVKIKPPWTLGDVFILLEEHWIAVFGHIIGRHHHKNVTSLNEMYLEAKTCIPSSETLKSMLELSATIMKGCQANSLYNTLVREKVTIISKFITKCDNVKTELENLKKEQVSAVVTVPTPPDTPTSFTAPQARQLTSYEKVRFTFDDVWNTANRYSALVFASLNFPNPLVKDLDPNQQLPSSEESIRCLSVMTPRINRLKQAIHDLLYSEGSDHETVKNLFNTICDFSREVTKHECPIYLDDLAEFCQDPSTREVFVQGLGQLDRLYATLQQCAEYFR